MDKKTIDMENITVTNMNNGKIFPTNADGTDPKGTKRRPGKKG